MVLAIQNINFIPGTGILDQIFHQSWLTISILGFPKGGYRITLIGLILILIIAVAANAITEKLTSRKVGGLLAAVIITLIGSALFQAYVLLPFDFSLENIRIVAALLGAIVIAVFYTLIKGSVSGKK